MKSVATIVDDDAFFHLSLAELWLCKSLPQTPWQEDSVGIDLDAPVIVLVSPRVLDVAPDSNEDRRVHGSAPRAPLGNIEVSAREHLRPEIIAKVHSDAAEHHCLVAGKDAVSSTGVEHHELLLLASCQHDRVAEERIPRCRMRMRRMRGCCHSCCLYLLRLGDLGVVQSGCKPETPAMAKACWTARPHCYIAPFRRRGGRHQAVLGKVLNKTRVPREDPVLSMQRMQTCTQLHHTTVLAFWRVQAPPVLSSDLMELQVHRPLLAPL
mmetsp:Transcript_13553/g.37620  ORF Transcript_13553/g.37620 Transcript_13553/m.37620 type:complete len:267 (-) Transcript_13553:768-1568(-)